MKDSLVSDNDVLDCEIELIGRYFSSFNENNASTSYSLLEGLCGTIVVQSVLFDYNSDEAIKKQICENLDRVMNLIEGKDDLSPTFCGGIAGVGWLFLYLNEKGIVEIDPEEFLSDIDEYLVITMNNFLALKNYDILHGALGIGIYFLKRGNSIEVEKVIKSLFNEGEWCDGTYKLSSFDVSLGVRIYNMGLAHGQAAILYFLGKCFKNNCLPMLCTQMINGIITFYFNNLLDNRDGPFFPLKIPYENEVNCPGSLQSSRLAWCYGDLGVLHTMLLVSGWIGDSFVYDKVEGLLTLLAKKRSLKECLLSDSHFCHGVSGVMHIYTNLYRTTGNIIFKEASCFWKDEMINLGKVKSNGVLGYEFINTKDIAQSNDKLLTGLGGVLATLISFKDDSIMDWQECLFLS